jgi:hypothetical protein
VFLDRALGDLQAMRDPASGHTLGEEAEDLSLSGRE